MMSYVVPEPPYSLLLTYVVIVNEYVYRIYTSLPGVAG